MNMMSVFGVDLNVNRLEIDQSDRRLNCIIRASADAPNVTPEGNRQRRGVILRITFLLRMEERNTCKGAPRVQSQNQNMLNFFQICEVINKRE